MTEQLEEKIEELEKELQEANELIEELKDEKSALENEIEEKDDRIEELEEELTDLGEDGICGYEIKELQEMTKYHSDESKFLYIMENWEKITEDDIRKIVEWNQRK